MAIKKSQQMSGEQPSSRKKRASAATADDLLVFVPHRFPSFDVEEATEIASDQNEVPLGGAGEEDLDPEFEGGDIDGDPFEITVEEKADGGCLACNAKLEGRANPLVEGDLLTRQSRDPLVLPACDGAGKPSLTISFDWKNQVGADFSGKKYAAAKTDASAFAIVEGFDDISDLARNAIGFVMTLPQTLTADGVSEFDNKLDELFTEMNEVFSGRADKHKLVSRARFNFEVLTNSHVLIRHSMTSELYRRHKGTAHLLSKTEIDGTEVAELEINDSAPAPVSGNGTAEGASSGSALSATEETRPFGSRVVQKRLLMNKGAHEASVFMSLSAGHSGIADETVKRALRRAIDAAVAAINRLTQAAVAAVNALIAGNSVPDSVINDLKEGAGSALTAAREALTALFQALRNLIFQSRAYVKLFTSMLKLECVGPET